MASLQTLTLRPSRRTAFGGEGGDMCISLGPYLALIDRCNGRSPSQH